MAEKMSKDLKFQLELAKKLYTGKDEVLATQIVVENVPFGNFSSLLVGWEDVLRHIDKEVISPVDLDNPYSYYTNTGRMLFDFKGYERGIVVGETNIGSPSRKKMIAKIAKDEGSVYVQGKYLEYFSATDEIWVKDEFSPVFIFRPNPRRIVGVIMPFIMKK